MVFSARTPTAHAERARPRFSAQRLGDLMLAVALAWFVVSLWPSLSAPLSGLDDRSLVQEFTGAPFSSVFGYDHFGHFRPAKNAYFWCLARAPHALWSFRALTLVAVMACALALRGLAQLHLSSRPASAAVAVLWLLNPSTVSAAAWLSASNYAFALLGVLAYFWLMQRPRGPLHVAQSAAAQLAWLWAGLQHELAWLAPLLFYVHVRCAAHGGGRPRPSFRSLAVGPVCVAVVALMLRFMHTAPTPQYRVAAHSSAWLVASSARYLLENLRIWLWPARYFGVLLTDVPSAHAAASAVAWVVVAIAIAIGLGWRAVRRDGASVFAASWLLATLLPVTNLVPFGTTPVAVHYLVWPGVGLAMLAVRALQWAAARAPRHADLLLGAGAAACVLAWQPAYRDSVRAFSDDVSLYETTLRHYPDDLDVRANLVATYLERRRYADAAAWLESSLAVAPHDIALLGSRFELLVATERLADAVAFLDAHSEYVDAVPEARVRRGLLLVELGRPAEAAAAFREVLRVSRVPRDRLSAGYQLAHLLVQAHQLADARGVLAELLREFPDEPGLLRSERLIDALLGAR